ncbi:hypothetical protein EGW08_014983 [Elysia chlorotica]|uniref:G-protein coupled receptors family 1 profile domain-containing protein n=1 Tax=Elysia chlorotica TaxID=188477 RepID=A0A433T6S2_ELYCH|nr:hypothetical protein EGW08_014983 [Elysia chlorotica]
MVATSNFNFSTTLLISNTFSNGLAGSELALGLSSNESAISAMPGAGAVSDGGGGGELYSPGNASGTSAMEEVLKATVNGLNTYAVPIICVLGIIGDVTSFLVFVISSFRYHPCSQYLAALAFVDTMFLLSQLINSLMTFFPSLAFAPGYCSVMVFLAYVCSFLSAWFVVLMMVERYIAVCHPFRASALCNKRKSIMVIAGLSLFSVLLYSHSFFTTIESRPCSIDAGSYGFLIVFTYLDSFLVLVVPFLAIVLLNLKVIFTVRGFRRQHNLLGSSVNGHHGKACAGSCHNSNNNSTGTACSTSTTTLRFHTSSKTLSLAQVRSTKMLVWVSSVFLVLYLPSYAARLYGLILQQAAGGFKSERQRLHFQIAQQLCQFLYFLNFAIDFLVYLVTSNNFRRNIRRFIKNIRVREKRSSIRRRPGVRGRL